MKKYQIMINNIAGKINKIPEFYMIFCTKNARLQNNTTRSRPGRGQNLEAEAKAEAKILASRPLWPRGLNITGVRTDQTLNSVFIVTITVAHTCQSSYTEAYSTTSCCVGRTRRQFTTEVE